MQIDPLVILILGAIPVGVAGLWAGWHVWREELRERHRAKAPLPDSDRAPENQSLDGQRAIRLGTKEKRTRQLNFRVSPDEYRSIHIATIKRGLSLGDYFLTLHCTALAKDSSSNGD